MRLITRRDASLATALLVSAFVMFNRPLRSLLDVVADVERTYQIDLLPALAVLAVTFAFHEFRKRVEAAEETRRTRARADEIERLLMLCKGLASALDDASLQQILIRLLPAFCASRSFWLVRRQRQAWSTLLQDMTARPPVTAELLESRAARTAEVPAGGQHGVPIDDDLCYPLIVGDSLVGALGVRNIPALSASESRALGAAASLVALTLRNLQVIQDAHDRGVLDNLTGCMTRTAGLARLDGELRRAHRTRRPLSVLLLDIDQFKDVNDTQGHLYGDLALEWVGRQLGNVLRASDVRCRLGGDEFLVVLPETPQEGAAFVAEKLRTEVSQQRLDLPGVPRVTISIGGVTADPGELSVLALVNRADKALYKAKHDGRNRVCFTSDHLQTPADVASWSERHLLPSP